MLRIRAADRRAVAAGTVAAALLALLALAGPAAGGPAPAPLRTAKIDGARIGYRVLNPAARGTPLVLITGYGATMAEWDPAFVARLATHRRVVMFDNRGMGNSTGPVDRLTVALMARDAAGLINLLKLRHPDVLGWSMGGFIAQQLALDEPGLVHRLILASTDPGSPHTVPGKPSVIRVLTSPQSTPTTLLPILFPARAQAAGVAWLHAIAAQPGLTGADFTAPAATLAAQKIATTADWLRAGDGTYAHLPRLTAPTLVAVGADDVIVPPRNAGLLLRRLPDVVGLLVPGAGHAFLFQQPAAVASSFSGFLDTGRVGHG
jgi:pimeloyl-ACP methyl ester carboxylesterase